MAFDQTYITAVRTQQDAGDLLVSWDSTAPSGSIYQLYVDMQLVWRGVSKQHAIAYPSQRAVINVGVVLPSEMNTNFASSLPAIGGTGWRATITWEGGTYLAADLDGFNVYRGTTPGGAVNYSTPVARVPAYPGGILLDGFGMGGFGHGGFGRANSWYSYTSDPLAPGTWNFAVKPVNTAGVEGTAATQSVAVSGPPEPVPVVDGARLSTSYNAGTRVLTISWQAAP